MGTKVNNNYEDLITFTRASKGHALRPVSYGTELVTNGDDFSSGWSGTGWTFSSGQASVTGNGTNQNLYGTPVSNAVVGKLYQLSYEVIASSVANGSFRAGAYSGASFFGGSFLSLPVSVGAHKVNFIGAPSGAGSVLDFWLSASAASGTLTIDNVSVKEVTFDESDGTLTLFEHPNNVPRVEYDADGNRLGLLVEESRTNYIGYSDFSSAWGVNLGGKITANQAEGLDKTQSMALLETSGISSGIYGNAANRSTASASGETYTLSVIVKHVAGGTQLRFRLEGTAFTGAIQGIAVDFSDGSFVSNSNVAPDAYEIKSFGNGFYKVSITGTTVASGDVIPVFYGNINEDADFYIGMAQLEAGSFPTSYIKSTSGSNTARSADVVSIPVADFGYNNKEITVMAEFIAPSWASSSRYHRVLSFDGKWGVFNDGSTATGKVRYRFDNDSDVAQFGPNNLDPATYGTSETMSKVAFALKNNDAAITKDGNTVVTDTAGDYDIELRTTLYIGTEGYFANGLAGHLKTLKIYPRRLTNAQLQALTEPRSTPTLSLTFDGQESSYKENYIHG